MKYDFTVQYKLHTAPISAIFKFTIYAENEEKAFRVAAAYESQLRKDNPWFEKVDTTMLRLA